MQDVLIQKFESAEKKRNETVSLLEEELLKTQNDQVIQLNSFDMLGKEQRKTVSKISNEKNIG